MAQVVLNQLCKSFDKTEVLKNIDLTVSDHEFVVLVGPSGCGKSTALRIIAGLETASSGDIEIGERRVNEVAPKDRDIAMVFQNYALYPHMNVYDNMAFGLKMRKFAKADIDKRVKDAAEILDLAHLLTRKPKQLSGGQRQRVALGRAIVRDPQVFLMDEPLSNLDAKLRVQMRSEIIRLHRRLDATTVYVTHDQVEAMTMGDRIVILDQGVIQQVDNPLTIYNQPANLFVAGFIGQMNFLSGTLDKQDKQKNALVMSDGTTLPLPKVTSAEGLSDGQQLVLGVRPEHFEPMSVDIQGPEITLTPTMIEPLGSENMVHFEIGGCTAVAKLPPDVETPVGQPVTLKIDLNHTSLFDAKTEKRLD
ncbi:MAG: sn-glycerol-3-phosphate ABC transporter ATP-binding protein UgpC [Vampirovibrio sp.]|nr:sn-glycerol-3-phosphate ABC transporter ATP-binding protein UgpC [Vampirovibrio sp.]